MTTEAEKIAELAQASAAKAEVLSAGDRKFLILPHNYQHHEVTNPPTDPHGLVVTRPAYVNQAVTLQTAESLGDYVERFFGPGTLMFADIAQSSICAIIDYHAASEGKENAAAAHTAHRADLKLPFAIEWLAWKAIDGRLVGQLDFARFIEENAADISAPPAADLFEAIRDIQAHRKVNFTAAVRTSTDNETFEYSEETKAATKNGGIEIPTKFTLRIPVYFGEPSTELGAFLRWKLDDGVLHLGIALHRAEHVRQAVFKQIVLEVAERTACPVVFGSP